MSLAVKPEENALDDALELPNTFWLLARVIRSVCTQERSSEIAHHVRAQ